MSSPYPPPYEPQPQYGAYGQPAYPGGQPAYPGGQNMYQGGPPSSGLAVGALVCGIVGLLIGGLLGVLFVTAIAGVVLGILGVVLGIVALKKVSAGTGGGKGMALAGIICGGIAIAASALWLLLWGAVANEFDNLSDCLNAADTSSEIDQCYDDYR